MQILNNPESPEHTLLRAKIGLRQQEVFYGNLLSRLKAIPLPCGSMGVDGEHLYYDPQFIAQTPFKQLLGVLAHEVTHVALQHPWRRRGRDNDLWQYACDCAVNSYLINNPKFELPEDAIYEERFHGLSAERIYDTLMRENPPPPPSGGGDNDEDGDGQSEVAIAMPDNGDGEGDDDNDDSNSGGDDQNQNDDNSGDQPDDQSGGGQGGGNQDQQEQNQDGQGDSQYKNTGGCGFVMDAPAKTEEGKDYDDQQRDWKVAAAQSDHFARQAGTGSEDVVRMLDEMYGRSKVDYRSLLQSFLDDCTMTDYSFNKPNRRYIQDDIYLPSRNIPTVREVVVALDTSGSMPDFVVHEALNEVMSLVMTIQPEIVHVIHCDYYVKHHAEITLSDLPLPPRAYGGGGTAFAPVFNFIERRLIEPTCLIYMTDMCCRQDRYPEKHPEYPVLRS